MKMKTKGTFLAAAAACCLLLITGCGPREQDVIVQQPEPVPERVIEKKTTVKPVPQKPKTVVVQPAPASKTDSKTNVKVTVQPKAAAPAKPAPVPTARPRSTPRPAASSPQKAKPTPRPRPTATPTPRPQQSAASLVARAEVLATSKVPDPKSVPYKEALVFIKYRVLEIERGKYEQKEILVAHWGLRDRKLQPAARLRQGQRQRLALVPLAGEKELQSVMQLDDTEEYELEPYFAAAP